MYAGKLVFAHPMGELKAGVLRLDFDRRLAGGDTPILTGRQPDGNMRIDMANMRGSIRSRPRDRLCAYICS